MSEEKNFALVIQEHLKPILQKYDKNANTNLQKEELRNLLADNLSVPAQSITQDQLDWHFDRIDEDHDGKITFEEYFNHFFVKRAKDARKKKSETDNEDELIDIDEFKRLMEDTFKPLNIKITQEMVQWNFDQIDKDHSGRISFAEFLAFIKKYN